MKAITQKINEKLLLTIYLLINLADFNRLAYTSAFAIFISNGLGDEPMTTLQRMYFYLCVGWMVGIHLALIVTLVLAFFKTNKPFLIASALDFIVYAFFMFFLELRYSPSDDFFMRFCFFALHLIAFLFVLYVCRKKTFWISRK